MDLKEELDSTVAMKLDKDNLAKILSLWLHVEALTPFDLDKNDLIEQMPGSLNQPRSSLFLHGITKIKRSGTVWKSNSRSFLKKKTGQTFFGCLQFA